MSLIASTNYTIYMDGEDRKFTITPVVEQTAGGSQHITGVYKLREGKTPMGEIVFDDKMEQWEYTGLGDLDHAQAAEIAGFIRDYNEED